MPYGSPGAYWMMLRDEAVQLKRTEYGLRVAADVICMSSYPGAQSFAASSILSPPSEEAMLNEFAGSPP